MFFYLSQIFLLHYMILYTCWTCWEVHTLPIVFLGWSTKSRYFIVGNPASDFPTTRPSKTLNGPTACYPALFRAGLACLCFLPSFLQQYTQLSTSSLMVKLGYNVCFMGLIPHKQIILHLFKQLSFYLLKFDQVFSSFFSITFILLLKYSFILVLSNTREAPASLLQLLKNEQTISY